MKKTLVLEIKGMHCSSCALNIDFELEDLPGVFDAKTSYARQKTSVSFDPEKVTEAQMVEVIERLGYEIKV